MRKRIATDEDRVFWRLNEMNSSGLNPAVDCTRADLSHAGGLFGGYHLNLPRAFRAPGENKSFGFADSEMALFKVEAMFDALRDDPRYRNILRRMNLEPT
jgi:hypothetical protein